MRYWVGLLKKYDLKKPPTRSALRISGKTINKTFVLQLFGKRSVMSKGLDF